MESLIQTYYQMSIRWAGLVKQAGNGHLPNSLYDSSFFHHRRVLGASGRTLPCFDSARWCLGK